MRRLICLPAAMSIVILFALGCQNPMAPSNLGSRTQDRNLSVHAANTSPTDGTTATTTSFSTDLIARGTTKVGTVTVTSDTVNVIVTFGLTGGWQMSKSQLAIALNLSGIPQTKRHNPKPGHFPFKTRHDPPVTTFSYSVPMAGSGFKAGDLLFIAAHAEVRKIRAHGRGDRDDDAERRNRSLARWDGGRDTDDRDDDEDRGNIEDWGRNSQQEDAWAAGLSFRGKEHATYFTFQLPSSAPVVYSEIVIDTYDPTNPTNPIAPNSSTMQLWSSDGKTRLAADIAGASRPAGWPYRFGAYIDYTAGLTSGDYWVLVQATSAGDTFGYAIRVVSAPNSSYSGWTFSTAATESVSDQPLTGGSGIPTTFQTMQLGSPPGTPSSLNHLNRFIVANGVNWIRIHLP